MKKKVIIIGGGLSGFTTGIYLQANGYDTEIVEKNAVSGGACIGWERKGCYIDGCIHWMTGVNPKTAEYGLWRDIHALKEDTEIFFQRDFAHFDCGEGKSLTIWGDLEELQAELLAFAPEDEKEIKRFCRLIKRFQRIVPPISRPADMMSLGELLKIGLTMAGDYYWITKTSKLSCADYAKRFKNEALRECIENYMAPGYNFMSLLYMLAHVTGKNGGIPIGGSLPLMQRVEKRYLDLGGKLRLNAEVDEVCIERDHARGVRLKNGEILYADWVVSATPVEHSLKKLLGGRYESKKFDKYLKDRENYPIYTYSTVVFKCAQDLSSLLLSLHADKPTPFVLDREYKGITFRNYSYDKTMKTPEGACVVQASIRGNDGMYFWWKDKKTAGNYREEKKKFGEEMLAFAEEYFPDLKGKIEVIDVVTPCTYERYLHSRHGCFQSFVQTATGKAIMEKGVVKGLKNFLLSGQWLLRCGGLPPAAITGKFAAQRICKADKKKFIYPERN
ncbi:MAG: NAD(P)/FAD-dependent oxidoreductase [Clostridia bacterium]|nr:NAD(P)/FAD-dependent oxidoreductase [Clostridia bacterium]